MLFTSWSFFVLLIITFTLYYLPPFKKNQIILLVIASLTFYAWEKLWLLALLILSVGINTTTAILVFRANKLTHQKLLAWGGVILNLAILASFKYNKLLINAFNDSPEHFSPVEKLIFYLPLPIGISFFTFEGISLIVDVYREKTRAGEWINQNPIRFFIHSAFFISFFPHLIAGPILKARDFYAQIGNKSFFKIDFTQVMQALIVGYFLKMVIADNLKEQTVLMGYPSFLGAPGMDLLLLVLGYSMQIFADFAGYSLIAIGLAALFGYELRDNFLFPYISSSFKEFWKRWHISLSSWLQEYLYYSLGGNKKGKVRTYFNLLITMVLGGLWHGAAWSYAIWGLFHGLVLAAERLVNDSIRIPEFPGYRILKILFVFLGVSFAWLLFRLPEFNYAVQYMETLVTGITKPWSFGIMHLTLVAYSIPVILYHAAYYFRDSNLLNPVRNLKPYWLGIMLFLILTNAGSPGSFIYFRF